MTAGSSAKSPLPKKSSSPGSKVATPSGKAAHSQQTPEQVLEAFLLSDTSTLTSLSDLEDISDPDNSKFTLKRESPATTISTDPRKNTPAPGVDPKDPGFMPSAANQYRFKYCSGGRTAAQLDRLFKPPLHAAYERNRVAISYERVGGQPCARDRDVNAMVHRMEAQEAAYQKKLAAMQYREWDDKDDWGSDSLSDTGRTVRPKRRCSS